MVKHTKTIRRSKPTNCLSVFGRFVTLALKGLIFVVKDLMYNGVSRDMSVISQEFLKFVGKF